MKRHNVAVNFKL